MKSLSRVRLFVTPWTAPASFIHGFSRQEYWSGLPFPSPRNLPNPGIALPSEPPGKSLILVNETDFQSPEL